MLKLWLLEYENLKFPCFIATNNLHCPSIFPSPSLHNHQQYFSHDLSKKFLSFKQQKKSKPAVREKERSLDNVTFLSMAPPKLCDKWNCLHVNGASSYEEITLIVRRGI